MSSEDNTGGAQGGADHHPTESVHQIIFRWQGGRDGHDAGMAPVAASCSREVARRVAAELGALLRVRGQAPPPSLVRTVLGSGTVALVQRWPVADAVGRPSTACHVLLGKSAALSSLRCVLLDGWSWSGHRTAQEAVGGLPRVHVREQLDPSIRRAADRLVRRVGTREVAQPLAVAVAQWLREPQRRLSVLSSGWSADPREQTAGTLIGGLQQVFGDWFACPWTFATHDSSDDHDLRVICVPDWRLDAVQGELPSRVDPQEPKDDRAQELAARLVDRLARRGKVRGEGDPALLRVENGARLSTHQRLDALERSLASERGRPSPASRRPSDEGRASAHECDPPLVSQPLGDVVSVQEARATSPADSGPADLRGAPPRERPAEALAHLLDQRTPQAQRKVRDDLMLCPDSGLIDRLTGLDRHSGALDLVLDALHQHAADGIMSPESARALCRVVLDQGLCRPDSTHGQGNWAAELFSWSVAPFARGEFQDRIADLVRSCIAHPGPEQRAFLKVALLEQTNPRRLPDLTPQQWQAVLLHLTVAPHWRGEAAEDGVYADPSRRTSSAPAAGEYTEGAANPTAETSPPQFRSWEPARSAQSRSLPASPQPVWEPDGADDRRRVFLLLAGCVAFFVVLIVWLVLAR